MLTVHQCSAPHATPMVHDVAHMLCVKCAPDNVLLPAFHRSVAHGIQLLVLDLVCYQLFLYLLRLLLVYCQQLLPHSLLLLD